MNIIGKGKRGVMDVDLLGKLAQAANSKSGTTISKKEAGEIIKKTVDEFKSSWDGAESTRGLTRQGDAIRNTLNFALQKGFVRGGAAQDIIEAFIEGDKDGSLNDVMDDIRADARRERDNNVGYSGGGRSTYRRRTYTRRRVSYSGS